MQRREIPGMHRFALLMWRASKDRLALHNAVHEFRTSPEFQNLPAGPLRALISEAGALTENNDIEAKVLVLKAKAHAFIKAA